MGISALSTDELQREIEAVMTPAMNIEGRHSMEWFLRIGCAAPASRAIAWSIRPSALDRGYVVKGKLLAERRRGIFRRAGAHLFQQRWLSWPRNRVAGQRLTSILFLRANQENF